MMRIALVVTFAILLLLYFKNMESSLSSMKSIESTTIPAGLSSLAKAHAAARGVDDFLNQPELKEFVKNSILMINSQSVQTGTKEFPRVILYSDDARTMLSYTGDVAPPKPDNIELIHFDQSTDTYRFYELSWRENKSFTEHTYDRDTESSVGCQSCHHGVPIWEPYDFWPGAVPKASVCRSPDLTGDFDEAAYFEQFKSRKEHRYQILDINCKSSRNLFLAEEMALGYHNKWIIRKFMRHKDYAQLKYAMAGALLDCPNLESFVNSCQVAGGSVATRDSFAQSTKDSFESADFDSEIRGLMEREGAGLPVAVIANLRYIFESSEFSMLGTFTSHQSPYFYSVLPDRYLKLLEILRDEDSDIGNLGRFQLIDANGKETFLDATIASNRSRIKEAFAKKEDIRILDIGSGLSDYYRDAGRMARLKQNAYPAAAQTCQLLNKLSHEACQRKKPVWLPDYLSLAKQVRSKS
jgi:hypothetical protein